MGKLTRTGCGFAEKGTKLLRHYGTRVNLPLPTGEVDFVSERSEFTKSGEGSIFKVLNGTRKKCAFTLSEVLIVLAVLGVVAAMTIPDLIQDAREKALITALKKNYTVFSQAVEMAIAENGPLKTWDIDPRGTSAGAIKLYNILEPYLRIEKTCGASKGCLANHYEALFYKDSYYKPEENPYYAKGVLASGASFFVWSNGTGCPSANYCGSIYVDVNGKAGPNKNGVDLFQFFIFTWKESNLTPSGRYTSGNCIYNDTSNTNGVGCAYWAIKNENMDYLRKDGVYTTRY